MLVQTWAVPARTVSGIDMRSLAPLRLGSIFLECSPRIVRLVDASWINSGINLMCAPYRRQLLLSRCASPLPRYGMPPYLATKDLGEGLIPFPYQAHTVCIPCIPASCRLIVAEVCRIARRRCSSSTSRASWDRRGRCAFHTRRERLPRGEERPPNRLRRRMKWWQSRRGRAAGW